MNPGQLMRPLFSPLVRPVLVPFAHTQQIRVIGSESTGQTS